MLAADNTVEIIIRVSSAQAEQALTAVKTALGGLGQTAHISTASLKEAEHGLTGIHKVFHNIDESLFKTIGALSLIGVAAIAVKHAFEALKAELRSVVEVSDDLSNKEIGLASQVTALSKENISWTRAMEYSSSVINTLWEKTERFGISLSAATVAMRAFADIGILPRSEADIENIAKLMEKAKFIGISRSGGGGEATGPMGDTMRMMMEIRGLIDGSAGSMARMGAIIAKNLGMNREDLAVWMQREIRTGHVSEMLAKMAAALHTNKEEEQAVVNLASNQKTLLEGNLDRIKIMAGGGLLSGITSAYKTINELLRQHGREIAEILRPAFDDLGRMIANNAQYIKRHWKEIAQEIRGAVDALGEVLRNLRHIGDALADISSGFVAFRKDVDSLLQPVSDLANRLSRGAAGRSGFFAPTAGMPESLPQYTGRGTGQIVFGSKAMQDLLKTGQFVSKPEVFDPGAITPPDFGRQGRGGRNEEFAVARDAIAEAAAHARAMADGIDDAAKREAAMAAITREEAASYAQLAAHTADRAKHAELLLKVQELLVKATNEERTAARDAIREQTAASNDFLAHLKAIGQLSPEDELAGRRRMQERLSGQVAASGPGVSAAAADLKRVEEEIYRITQEIRKRDEQANKASLDEQLKAVQDHMSDLEAAGQLSLGMKVELLRREIEIVRDFEGRKLILHKEAVDRVAQLDREVATTQRELFRQQEEDAKKAAEAMKQQWEAAMKPQIEAATRMHDLFVSSFGTAFDEILNRSKTFGQALLGFFRSLGQGILAAIGKSLAQDIANLVFPIPKAPDFAAMTGYNAAVNRAFAAVPGAYTGIGGGATPQPVGMFSGLLDVFKGLFHFQGGGIVTGPTLGLLGERGPEAVLPLDEYGRAGEVNLHVHAMDSADVASFFAKHGDALAGVIQGRAGANSDMLRPFMR